MSALGQKQTLQLISSMSALPPKADIGHGCWDVRFVPKADIGRCGWGEVSKAYSVARRDVPRRTTNVG